MEEIENKIGEAIKEDLLESEHSKEQIIINLESSHEIYDRKRIALLQALEILESVSVYGELDTEKTNLRESLEEVDSNMDQLQEDIIELKEMEV